MLAAWVRAARWATAASAAKDRHCNAEGAMPGDVSDGLDQYFEYPVRETLNCHDTG